MNEMPRFAITDILQSAPAENQFDASHADYPERVYAGVLGKLIGVYLGRPVENWTYERIAEEIGDVDYYIHEQRGRRLIITDDDISGTFTFLRALEDYGFNPNLTSRQVGQTWLNYLIEKTTILWWGGLGNSTEHTAYLRLKKGIDAPRSGSAELNSKVLSEQIGAQIFIDGWGLICPGDPAHAARFAEVAARVSHDGEAVYGAKMVATMVAQAFVESDIDALIDCGLSFIPSDSTVARMIHDLRDWHAREPDWRENRAKLVAEYGYDRYRGQCHLIPNHGLIILSLLHGAGDFDHSMMIVNTAGMDTDCNSGNVGTILGVRNGLPGFTGKDWRGPVADRLFLPSADGGRSITDAAQESMVVTNVGRALLKLEPIKPKDGARFHFTLSGSVQGWRANEPGTAIVSNDHGNAGLWMEVAGNGPARVGTDTFIPPETRDMKTGYVLVANPTLYPGHVVRARVAAGKDGVRGRMFLGHYNAEDETDIVWGPELNLRAEETREISWQIPDTEGFPIHQIGFELESGGMHLDWLTWSGVPTASFPILPGTMAARAWAKSVDRFEHVRDRYDYLCHNEGTGLLTHGARDWKDYRVDCRITPKMAVSAGVAVRVQGLRRYYAVVFADPGQVRIEKILDGRQVLAQTSFPWENFEDYHVEVEAVGDRIRVWIDGRLTLSAVDSKDPMLGGAFGFLVEEGCMGAGTPRVMPA